MAHDAGMEANGRIVVGVDGSGPSLEALRWALDEAPRRACRVEAVHAWRYPAVAYVPGIVPTPVFAEADLEAEGRAVLDRSVEMVLADRHAGTAVDRVLIHGGAVESLLARARGADVLVVGHRGRDGLGALLLGSVAKGCVAHAPCPVVVVRPPAGAAKATPVETGGRIR